MCENIVSNPKLLRCLCTYCEFCLQSLRKDDKITCLVCKQESIFREESVDDYTYHHSMIIHDNFLEFNQFTFERAIEILESMKSLYPKGSCANCSRNKKKKKKANRYELYRCNDCTTVYYCSSSCQMAHVRHAQDCIQMIKCRKYIYVHRDNHPVYKINKDISKEDKEVYHVFMMREGSPVTQEFSTERKKMINDSFMFRLHVEEFFSLSKLALHDKSK